MQGTLERTDRESGSDAIDVLVYDINRQESLDLPALDPGTTAGDVLGISASRMALTPDVKWLLRDDRTSRLLRKEQSIGEVAHERKARLTIQPDVILG